MKAPDEKPATEICAGSTGKAPSLSAACAETTHAAESASARSAANAPLRSGSAESFMRIGKSAARVPALLVGAGWGGGSRGPFRIWRFERAAGKAWRDPLPSPPPQGGGASASPHADVWRTNDIRASCCSAAKRFSRTGRTLPAPRVPTQLHATEAPCPVTIPGKAGGLSRCEPLKGAEGDADASPVYQAAYSSHSAPQIRLIQSLIFLLLVLDIVSDHFFVPSYGQLRSRRNIHAPSCATRRTGLYVEMKTTR